MNDDINENEVNVEDRTFISDDSAELPPSDIIAFNELRSCADLVRMFRQKILEINPYFQRNFIWPSPSQTRFIDSLTKQLPIPSMCFAVDHKKQKWMVIDGLQRMSTIIRFMSDDAWVLSKLSDIDPNLKGKSNIQLRNSNLYTRVENLTIPITMLRCDFDNKHHMEYLFTIFHRLNTGGSKLNNQEIRNCIYTGTFNSLIRDLDTLPVWKNLTRGKSDDDSRLKYQEIILRFFSFYDRYTTYNGQLSKFLNLYMYEYRNPSNEFLNFHENLFITTVELIDKKYKKRNKRLSITVLEALLVGVGKNIDFVSMLTPAQFSTKFQVMLNEPEFLEESIQEGLSKKNKVIDRINKAISIFRD